MGPTSLHVHILTLHWYVHLPVKNVFSTPMDSCLDSRQKDREADYRDRDRDRLQRQITETETETETEASFVLDLFSIFFLFVARCIVDYERLCHRSSNNDEIRKDLFFRASERTSYSSFT